MRKDQASIMFTDADEIASNEGLIIVEPLPNELQIDIDSPIIPKSYNDQRDILCVFKSITNHRITTSKSGNKHIYIQLKDPITPVERILLQLALGSDPVRELLTYHNILDPTNLRPQFLFEVKPK